MLYVAFFLKIIVLVSDIVLCNVYGKACLFVCIVKCAFEDGEMQALAFAAPLCGCFVKLHSKGINRRTLGLDFLNKVYG